MDGWMDGWMEGCLLFQTSGSDPEQTLIINLPSITEKNTEAVTPRW